MVKVEIAGGGVEFHREPFLDGNFTKFVLDAREERVIREGVGAKKDEPIENVLVQANLDLGSAEPQLYGFDVVVVNELVPKMIGRLVNSFELVDETTE